MNLPTRIKALLLLTIPLLAPSARAEFTIDADFPGGNGIITKVEGDDVTLYPDLRDTNGAWFYWHVRAKNAAGRTLTFHFSRYDPIGVRGPAVSLDGGKTWAWAGKPTNVKTFTYAVPNDAAGEVRFSFGMPYAGEQLEAFLASLSKGAAVRREELTKSKKGRSVPRLRVGKVDGEPKFRVLFTARHHACEMMMSYALEGVIAGALADDETGKWLREHVEILIIPFVDRDGVEDGDQGKNRKPRDHNRDYDKQSIHPETAAIREYVPKWSNGKLIATFDMHCPSIRGDVNERLYQVGREDPAMAKEQTAFGEILEKVHKGPIPYKIANDVPFGTSWNTAANYTQGMSSGRWGASQPGVRLATTFELPYANSQGVEVNAKTARAFGRDIAAALKMYLDTP